MDSAAQLERAHSGVGLEPRLVSRLRAVASRIRWFVLIEGLGWVALYLLAAMFAQFLLDYSTHGVRWSIRAAVLTLIVCGAIWLLVRYLIDPLRVRCGLAEVANLVERRYPQLRSGLISAVRFSDSTAREGQSSALMDSVIAQADRRAEGLPFEAILDGKRAKRAGFGLVAMLVLVGIVSVSAPKIVGKWFERNVLLRETPWPKQTTLVLDHEGEEVIAARGDDVLVQAYAEGRRPRDVEIIFRTERGQRGRESMVTVGRDETARYRHTFKNVQENLTFYLKGGDDQTREFSMRLMDRPSIESTKVRIQPPAYTRLDAVRLGDGQRSAQILPGSEVTIEARTNKPVAEAALMSGDVRAAEAHVQTDGVLVARVQPLESQTYQFALVDQYGLENKQIVSFAFRMLKDDVPTVKLKLNGVGEMITPQAILPIEVECADTYGLATAAVEYQLSRDEGAAQSIELPDFTEATKAFVQRLSWKVTDAGAVAGETLKIFAHATDFDDISGPNVGRSPEFRLRVVTPDDLLAELARREQEYRADFERLVDAQEQLRGGLLSELRKTTELVSPSDLAAAIAPLERRQRNISVSVNVIRQQFERIMAERRINQLDTREEDERLGQRIVDPLSNLARRDLIGAADAIRQWSAGGTEELGRRIDLQQAAIVTQMREILANMIQWEGYQEVVTMLRDILRLQKELGDETRNSAEKQGDGVFED